VKVNILLVTLYVKKLKSLAILIVLQIKKRVNYTCSHDIYFY